MEFKKYKLNEILTLNPTLKLKKNTIAKKIAMENIKEYQKKIDSYTYSEFKSGSKFMNGDTLLARITPCLENGKTAYVDILDKNEIAFGSTEFFVLRPKNSLLDSHFLYYLMRTNELRKTVIKSMTGTSGRQRAQKESILEYEFCLPSLKVQKTIAKLLKNLDDKIEINKKIIANLEEFSQTIFKRWFVDFEFPDENGNPYKSSGGEMVDSELGEIPSGWKIIELKEVTEIIMGQSPKSDTYNTQNEGLPLLNGATDFKNRNIKPTKYTTDPKKIGQFGDFVFGVRATVGLVTELDRDYAIGRGAGIARINSTHKEWLYEILVKAFQYFENSISGSVYINVSSNDLKKSKVIYPSKKILDAYHKNLVNNFELVKSMKMQIKHLTQLRDTLLPKLMAGEIEIPDDIEVNKDELSI